MIVGIMQPYFFPYLGYFDLINRSDRWIVFDTPQYMREGWVNRNRILHAREGWQYIIVPLKKHAQETPINQIEAVEFPDWRRKIINQFTHYRGRAPYYKQTIALLEDCFSSGERNLSRLNVICLAAVCRHLGIAWAPEIFSEMHLELGPVAGAADWALRIAESVKATEYLNPPGGATLYDAQRFSRYGIRLHLQENFDFEYACPGFSYVPKLSVLDVLMWVSPAAVKAYLDQVKWAASERNVADLAGALRH
jgi:WbqC-like protein family